ncbi:glycosyltransferase family 4 protein [Candidatus Omnitrophota bacterium]
MRIGLETTWINVPDGGGRYTNEIVRNLCTFFPEHEFFAVGPTPHQNHDYPNLTQVPFPDTVGLKARFSYTFRTAPILKKLSLDLYHILVNFGIYSAPCPVVTTVHDLLTLKYPELRSKKIHWWLYRYYVPSLVKKADSVIAVSNRTADDLTEHFGLSNVHAIHHGYNRVLFSPEPDDDSGILEQYGLQPGYLMFVGNLIPKKNVEVIVHALHKIRKRGVIGTKLVLVGKRGHGLGDMFRYIERHSLSDDIIELGYVPDEHLGSLYRQAFLFLFPSRYEGFGFPVIEAMACGTPVLVSNAGPLPELVENEDYMCSPDSVDDWAEKIIRFQQDAPFHSVARSFCLARAQQFSWEQCVREYMEIYESNLDNT